MPYSESHFRFRYAIGLLLISPLGDLVRRRPLLLLLTFLSGALSIGLPLTHSVPAFESLSFLVGIVTVVPQILMPLAADLAPPERRASALSIVLSGLLFGVLIARVLSGVIAQFITWRVVYYLAVAVQFAVLFMLYFMIPDYPQRNKGLTYWGILWTMAKFSVTEPLLIQAVLVNIASMATFSNFWVSVSISAFNCIFLTPFTGHTDFPPRRPTLQLQHVRTFPLTPPPHTP